MSREFLKERFIAIQGDYLKALDLDPRRLRELIWEEIDKEEKKGYKAEENMDGLVLAFMRTNALGALGGALLWQARCCRRHLLGIAPGLRRMEVDVFNAETEKMRDQFSPRRSVRVQTEPIDEMEEEDTGDIEVPSVPKKKEVGVQADAEDVSRLKGGDLSLPPGGVEADHMADGTEGSAGAGIDLHAVAESLTECGRGAGLGAPPPPE